MATRDEINFDRTPNIAALLHADTTNRKNISCESEHVTASVCVCVHARDLKRVVGTVSLRSARNHGNANFESTFILSRNGVVDVRVRFVPSEKTICGHRE